MINKYFNIIANNTKYSVLFLIGLSLFFFIGLGNVHLFDWDEINFAESAREMIASNDYLRVQINYSPFWEKPPFFFWLQVGAMKLFGINEFAARFPNALFGLIYLLTFYFIGKKHFSAKLGLIWAVLFFGSFLPHLYFKSGIIDPVFNYFIFMSIYFLMRVLAKEEAQLGKLALISGVFSGLSAITKGPVGFLLLGLTLLIYLILKKFKPFPHIKHIALFFVGMLGVIGAWLSMEVAQNGFAIIQQFIEYQIELFNQPVAGHAQPFYYHFVVVFIGCFPISIFALPYFRRESERLTLDFRVWMLSLFWVVLILFSISTTKIVHYSSMTYIPLSFLAAYFLYQAIQQKEEWKKYQTVLFIIVGSIWGILLTAMPLIMKNKELLFPYMNDPFAVESMSTPIHWSGFEFLIGILFFIGMIISAVFLKRKMLEKALVTISKTVAFSLLLVLFFILPKIEGFTQGPVVSFYESIQGEDCYVESFGYKSYAQYYYFQQPAGLSDQRKDQNWLVHGDIDKNVYMVSKSTNTQLDSISNFKLIDKVGGFRFYKREMK
ncbi:MAG TPA: glycosyltransferase family 39 protein [Crocinitomicaceae bacterium]|nr:glycosyltransferase family 39 protein [Crocinitomicaceae bacterium]